MGSKYNKKYYETNKEKIRAYEKENKDTIKARHAIWKQNNKEHIKQYQKEYDKEYCKLNKEKIQEQKRKYREVNKEQLHKKKKEYYEVNKEINKEKRKANRHKQTIRKAFDKLVTNWKGKRPESEKLLSYTFQDLKEHLSKFGDMNDMDIDHILPLSFLKKYIEDEQFLLKVAHDFRNLMLLSGHDNRKKGPKLTIEYIPSFHMYDFFEYVCELIEYKESLSKENESSLVI